MSLMYLMGVLIVVMILVLLTLSHQILKKYAGYLSLLAPIISSVYFITQISKCLSPSFHFYSYSMDVFNRYQFRYEIRWIKFNVWFDYLL